MIVKFISRVGTAGTRCAKRLAKLTVGSPNAQLLWKKSLNQQSNRNFSALVSSGPLNNLAPVHIQLLSVADPMTVGRRTLQTKGDKELVDFLEDEISAEKKSLEKFPDMSPFQATSNDAKVTLTRKMGDEVITIIFNVNNSMDTDEVADVASERQAQMISRPNFSVEIERGGKVLSLDCSFTNPFEDQEQPQQQDDDAYANSFTVNELSVYEGDFSETTYSTAGDILDENLYDLLMNMLEDRGITNEFVQKLSDYSTVYEHQRYVNLLENLKKFFN